MPYGAEPEYGVRIEVAVDEVAGGADEAGVGVAGVATQPVQGLGHVQGRRGLTAPRRERPRWPLRAAVAA